MTDQTLAAPASPSATRTTTLAAGVTMLALAAMAVDHLLGEDPGLEDPPMFAISIAACGALALALFGRLVPRAARRADGGASVGLTCTILAVVPGITLLWVGLPFIAAGAGLALGLNAREQQPSRRAGVTVGLSALALVAFTVAYVVTAVDKLA